MLSRNGAQPGHSWRATAGLSLILSCELLLSIAADWPIGHSFRTLAFEDGGGSLLVQQLVGEGLRPGVDFFYPYGLLPVLIVRSWCTLFGFSVTAVVALTAFCNLSIAWGLARFATAVQAPRVALVLLAVATPLVIQSYYLNVTHALEAALLVHALAAQARGARSRALALVVVSAFVKASMAYVYGLLLLLQLAGSMRSRYLHGTLSNWWRELSPAMIVGSSCLIGLSARFGPRPLLATQIPTAGRHAYAIMNYGFFCGIGRNFWHPPGAGINYYLGRFAGAWLACSGLLVIANVVSFLRPFASRPAEPIGSVVRARREMLLVTLILHTMFVCFFYGVAWDWRNYGFVLVLGAVCAIGSGRAGASTGAALIALMLVVHSRTARDQRDAYRRLSPSSVTANLWASAEEHDEWQHVLELTRGRRPVLFKMSGCAGSLFPAFQETGAWYVVAPLLGLLPPPESERLLARLTAATDVVVHYEVRPVLALPEFQRAMANRSLYWHGRQFDVYRSTAMGAAQ